jgi:hypothetical protein
MAAAMSQAAAKTPPTSWDVATLYESAVGSIGMSILKGAFSTFSGVCLLGGASAEIFRIFFKMLFAIVVLGLFTGFLLFPSMVTLTVQALRYLNRNKGNEPQPQ